jgi:hypothetical protein
VPVTEDHGIRLDKPRREGATFRPTLVTETLEQTHNGYARYVVQVSGPVQTKAATDSKASSGRIEYGSGWGLSPLADLPKHLAALTVGPDALAKGINLPKDGAR